MSISIARVDKVSKRFVVHQHKSLKERLVNARRGKEFRQDFWALQDINLDIKLGSTVGLVGHNGSGKSTLLKVIGGIIAPSSGTVHRRGRMAALLELGAGFHQDLTGRDNVYLNAAILGLTKKETDQVFDSIVEFSGISEFIDTQVKFYSSGMYVRLAFAVAVHSNPDLLLVDEVLAVGDEPFQRKCIDKITEFQREGRTIIVVSHSAAQVLELCDRVIVLDHGKIQFDGDPREGIDVLRQGYEAQTGGSKPLSTQEVVSTESSGTHISRLKLSSDMADLSGEVPSRTNLDFEFEYECREGEGPLIASLVIETAQREAVYWLDTRMLGDQVPSTPGRHSVIFHFEGPALGEGQYLIKGQLWRHDGSLADEIMPGPQFTIKDSFPGGGQISIDVSMTDVNGAS